MTELAIHKRFPDTTALPHAALAQLPTPLESHDDLAAQLGLASLVVKRDDLTSPVYGGNKVRKLEFLLGQAVAEERRAVITFGAFGSNHALATAVHAKALGVEAHVVLSPQDPGPYARATLLAHAALGTHIHIAEGWDGRREAAQVRKQLWERDHVEPLIIPMGGSNAVGAVGYVNAALEICDQAGEDVPDLVYVAAGTMGTAAGLALGFAAAGVDTKVVAILVTPREIGNMGVVRSLVSDAVGLIHAVDSTFPIIGSSEINFDMRREHYEPGYGIVTPETTAAVALGAGEDLKLETTYTGKAFWALFDDARQGHIADSRVLFVDTYNSAPMPAPGPVEALPEALQEYIAECDRQFGEPEEGLLGFAGGSLDAAVPGGDSE